MNKMFIVLSFCLISPIVLAQNDEEFDILKAPVSPASSLLGFAQSDIDKPTDVSEFMVSLQSASDNFSKLPSNFAIDIAPFKLVKSATITKDLKDSTVNENVFFSKNNFKQTLILSLSVKNVDSTTTYFNRDNTYVGFGFKFSILRGRYSEKVEGDLNLIYTLQKQRNESFEKIKDSLTNENKELKSLQEEMKRLNTEIIREVDLEKKANIEVRLAELETEIENEGSKIEERAVEIKKESDKITDSKVDNKIKKIASEFQLTRVGFTWDVAGGISGEFHNKSFNHGKIYNAGIWTTLGYTTEKSGAFLGLVRYLYNPERIFALDNEINELNSVSTFDTGFRYILGEPQAKFNASLEAIYRSCFSDNETDNSWRLMLNLDYALFKNQKVTFSFGKNYDGTTAKDGNLVAALGMVFGFGNK